MCGAEPEKIYPRLIKRFETDRRILKTKDLGQGLNPGGMSWFANYLSVYNDRASYRVADTFSVLSRDVILHLANHYYRKDDPQFYPFKILERGTTMQEAESLLHEFLELTDWGTLNSPARWA